MSCCCTYTSGSHNPLFCMTGARSGAFTQNTSAVKQPPTAAPGHPVAPASCAARGAATASSEDGGVAPDGEGEAPLRRSTRSGAARTHSTCTAVALSASAAAPATSGEPPIARKKRKRRKGKGASKHKPHAKPRASPQARPAPDLPSQAICTRVSRIIRRVTLNLSGNVKGVDGNINARWTSCILRSLRVKGRRFVDFGCGFGWMLAAALAMGALRAVGVEFPENKPQKRIFKSVMTVVQQEKVGFAAVQQEREFILLDINEVVAISHFSSFHSFT
jgi:hypothetical protein